MRFYRIKHKPTGLYYQPGTNNLSEKGKVYTGGNNIKTLLNNGYAKIITIQWDSKIHKKYKDILESLDICDNPIMVGTNHDIRRSAIEILVHSDDFEKEYITE